MRILWCSFTPRRRNVAIHLFNEPRPTVFKVAWVGIRGERICLTVVTVFLLWFGYGKEHKFTSIFSYLSVFCRFLLLEQLLLKVTDHNFRFLWQKAGEVVTA